MLKYIVKRILSAIPVLLIVVFITFFMMRMLPGDVAVLILGRDASPGDLAILRETLGLNKPYLVQFVDYIGDLLRATGACLCTTTCPYSTTSAAAWSPPC